jgi:4-amino-4-deoxy-L-arabinose transferase-like glycosyltransferase
VPVSAVDCVQPALQHTREQLFTRFRWGQWSRLALVGILAAELHVGGCNFSGLNFPGIHPQPRRSGHGFLSSSSLPFGWPPANPGHIPEHIGQFIGLIVVGIFAFIVLAFVFLYINSVFRFILFDSVLRRQCSISEGWRKWRRAGGRFFLWQLVFQISVWLFLLVLIGVPLAVVLAAGWATDLKEHIGRIIVGVILFVGLILVFTVATAVVQVLAKDFLVPIMALEGLDFADGWHRLLAMIRPEKGRFAIYLLLKLVLSIAAAILFGIIALIPALFLFVPAAVAVIAGHAAGMGWSVTTISLAIIFGTVLLLLLIYLIALVCVPATVFFPAYAMHFFAARYPHLNALLNPAPAPPAPELPPVPESPPPFEAPPLPPSAEPIG